MTGEKSKKAFSMSRNGKPISLITTGNLMTSIPGGRIRLPQFLPKISGSPNRVWQTSGGQRNRIQTLTSEAIVTSQTQNLEESVLDTLSLNKKSQNDEVIEHRRDRTYDTQHLILWSHRSSTAEPEATSYENDILKKSYDSNTIWDALKKSPQQATIEVDLSKFLEFTKNLRINGRLDKLHQQRVELQSKYHFGEGRVAGNKKRCCFLPKEAEKNLKDKGPLGIRSPV